MTAVSETAAAYVSADVKVIPRNPASLMEPNNRLTQSLSYRDRHFGLFWGLGYFWSIHLLPVTTGTKSDVIFLLSDPDFPKRRRNFAPILLSFPDMMRVRQTDRQQT